MNWSVPWHTRQKEVLESLSKNPSHAYLFSWPKWVWKLDIAKDFAKKILELNEEDWKKVDKNVFQDCIVLDKLWTEDDKDISSSNFPQEHRVKAKLKTDIISIDDIHEIIKIANKKPQFSSKKVIIIRDVERMNISSANAFLKTLEEPADDIFFICTTSNRDLLLETIVSRLQELEFSYLWTEEVKRYLSSKWYVWDIEKASQLSFWKLDRANFILNEDEWIENVEAYLKIIKWLYDWKSRLEKIQWATYQAERKEDLAKEIEYWAFFLWEKIKSWDENASRVYSNYLTLLSDLKSNVNKKLALEHFYFSF